MLQVSPVSSSSIYIAVITPGEATYQTVHYADVPLVLFEPQVHVLTHAVETTKVGGTAHLPVTL